MMISIYQFQSDSKYIVRFENDSLGVFHLQKFVSLFRMALRTIATCVFRSSMEKPILLTIILFLPIFFYFFIHPNSKTHE